MKVFMLILLLFGVASWLALTALAQQQHRTPVEVCFVDEPMRERARQLILDGIDQALVKHTIHMFEVWMKDPTDQPRRAAVGMAMGHNAYVGARTNAMNWNPPICPAGVVP